MPVEFRLLGPLEVRRDEEPLRLSSAKQRTLLADLLLHQGEVVSVDRLIEDLYVLCGGGDGVLGCYGADKLVAPKRSRP